MTTTDTIRRAIVNQGAFFSPYYLFDLLGRQHAEELDPLGREANRRLLRQTFRKASERYGESGSKPGEAWQAWYEELFTALGFDADRLRRLDTPLDAGRFGLVPISHAATAPGAGADSEPLVFVDLHGFGVDLDRAMYPNRSKIVGHSSITIEPVARAVEFALDQNETRWAIVAAGERLRLYRKGGSVARQYLEVAFTPLFDGDRTDEWTAFWGLFRYDAFVPDPASGKCLLDRVLEESQRHAARIADDLRENIVLAVEALIQGVLDEPANKGLFDRNDRRALQQLFEETLYVLYRLLFVLYAESRDLLPLGESPVYRDTYSLEHLRAMAEQPIHPDDYHKTYYIESLRTLFGMLRAGFPAADRPQAATPFRIPPFNGQLFDPARTALLDRCQIGDRAMREVIRELSLSRPRRRNERRERYSYADLGVDQLGSIYEGLLVYEPAIVSEETVIAKVKGEERLVTRAQAEAQHLNVVEGSERQPGTFVLRVWGGRRKGSGSYYTPQEITAFLVKEALESLVEPIIAGCAERDDLGRPHRSPDEILDLKVADPAMGSAAFLVQACRYLAEAYGRARIAAGLDEDGRISQNELARFKRRIAERCLYGVDLNPMAVELAKVSLWLETLSSDRPLTFLDAHLRCGNALVGAPLRDGEGALNIQRILSIPDAALEEVSKEATKAQKAAARDRIKRNREQVKRIQQQRAGQMRLPGEEAFDIYAFEAALADTLERRRELEISDEGKSAADAVQLVHAKQRMLTNLERSPASRYRRAKLVLDLWCATWFWPEPGSLLPDGQEAPEPPTTAQYLDLAARVLTADEAGLNALEHESLLATALQVAGERRFFHWELELPEVFNNVQGGFNAIVANPPWETVQLRSPEFWSDYNPLFSEMDKQTANQYALSMRSKLQVDMHWKQYSRNTERESLFFKMGDIYRYGGRGEPNTYRLFTERAYNHISVNGLVALLFPTAFNTDLGATDLRELLLEKTNLKGLFCFSNEKMIFPSVGHNFKFAVIIFQKAEPLPEFPACFLYEVRDSVSLSEITTSLSKQKVDGLKMSPAFLRKLSPETLTIMEFKKERDVQIVQKIYLKAPLLGEKVLGAWNLRINREFNMSDDSPLFNDEGRGMPLIEGRSIYLYDSRAKSYVSGRGRSAVWQPLVDVASKVNYWRPQWWVDEESVLREFSRRDLTLDWRIAICDVTGPTNTRTLLSTIIPPSVITGHSVNVAFVESSNQIDYDAQYFLTAAFNSFVIDFVIRLQIKNHASHFILNKLPIPRLKRSSIHFREIVHRVKILLSQFPEYHNLEINSILTHTADGSGTKPHLPTTYISEIDALVADLYGLSEEDFAYILSTFPLLDRDQPALAGDKDEKGLPRSYITRDVALLELFKLRGKEPPADIVAFFAAAGVDIEGRTGSLRGLRERVDAALALGAVAYVPSGRGGKGEEADELVETEEEE